ncbi:transposase [Paeniglutamicibacter sp.]|uniref:transposase n=1 Tax=Paeniglutamicibacter sp. TaxID=1934391 RepID=UPI0039894A3A
MTFKPSLSLEQVVRRMKMLTTHKLWAAEPAALSRHFWGSRKRLWSGGYFASTVGYSDTQATTAYIRTQAK